MTNERVVVDRDRHGFRVRAPNVTRLDAFVDAAFAFAVTMLVISVDQIPSTMPELIEAAKAIPTFAACFALIAVFWNAHATWSRRYGLVDGWSKVLSLFLVFLVLIYVYPLRLNLGMFFGWISGGWLPPPIPWSNKWPDLATEIGLVYSFYSVAFATMSLCIVALYWHAWRRRAAIGLDREEAARTLGAVATYGMFVACGLLSIGLAVILILYPAPWWIPLPGFVYFLLFFTGVVASIVQMHAWRKLVDEQRSTA